jgi:tRNA(Arg) A34 adenosine deaminase TadA
MSLFQTEKDAIVFLGLMAYAYKNYDAPVNAPGNDGGITHTNGLNIFAAITDNVDGEVVSIGQNLIHSQNNPMLHAEQLTLKKAIDRINTKRPRDEATTSVERYYRELLFNAPDSEGDFMVGGSIYTTLEPCPFCTSALLVNRMKRIVYIIPDAAYGGSYPYLKEKFYSKYDIVMCHWVFLLTGIVNLFPTQGKYTALYNNTYKTILIKSQLCILTSYRKCSGLVMILYCLCQRKI